MIDRYIYKKSFSYPERWRDWPLETSATDLKDTVLIPAGESLIDRSVCFYLSVTAHSLGRVGLFCFFWMKK
jgi:hypothetical protein